MNNKNNYIQWEGGRIVPRLQLWPHEDFPGTWTLHGKEENHAATASPEDLLNLAHTILRHFGHLQENTFTARLDNNLILRLPEERASKATLAPGAQLSVTIMEHSIVITKAESPITLGSILDEITNSNIHSETDTGPNVGRELPQA